MNNFLKTMRVEISIRNLLKGVRFKTFKGRLGMYFWKMDDDGYPNIHVLFS